MSLQDKKASLFGKSSDKKTASSSSSSSVSKPMPPPPPPAASISKSMPPPVSGGSSLSLGLGLSDATKKKKLEEGQALSVKAKKYLETSMFKWKPDHLAAAPLMEKAAECYRAASDLQSAKQLFVEASESHEACNAFAGSALALVKASDCCKEAGNPDDCADLLQKAAYAWGMYGDTSKTADTYVKAAKILETALPEKAKALYDKGCDMAFPASTPKERIPQLHPGSLEMFRDKFNFLLKQAMYTDALTHASRMISLFRGFGSDNSMTKTMLAITVLQLTVGDVVKAEQTHLQEHFNNSTYLNSKECKLADEFIMAFKNFDGELLVQTQAAPDLNYVDREIQNLARKLTFKSKKKEAGEVGSVTAKVDNMQVQDTNNAGTKSALFASKSSSTTQKYGDETASVSSVPVDMIKEETSTIDGSVANNDDEDDPFDANGNLKSDNDAPAIGGTILPEEEDDDEIDLT